MMKWLFLIVFLGACARLDAVGIEPPLTKLEASPEHKAMVERPQSLPLAMTHGPQTAGSLWSSGRMSLHGDRRASRSGDILTVVIEIDDRAEFSNSTERARAGSENLAIPDFLGLPEVINRRLPTGASLDTAADFSGASSSSGDGAIRRNEKLTLRVAASVTDELPNGVVRIEGTQEVRVNFEVRELTIAGFVRPEDISRQNEITYDKIASARISYGGRGLISDVQQPRYGQQVADIILPF